jgi:hypothetical protein
MGNRKRALDVTSGESDQFEKLEHGDEGKEAVRSSITLAKVVDAAQERRCSD